MVAVRKTGRTGGAELVELPIPRPGPGEVLVKVRATSICGTDVHIYGWNAWAEHRIRHVPQTLGHEFAGDVVDVGPDVRQLRVGDYVSAETHIPCLRCQQCLTGQMHICHNLKILGVDCDGCFAEYAIVPEIVAWKNDRSIPASVASVQEPLGNAVYCTLVEPVVGKSVLIFGDGPTGLFAAAVARVAGATDIVLVGREDYRLDIARRVGADMTINGATADVSALVAERTHGLGVDVVLEMSGTQLAVDQGLELVRKGGRFSAFGLASAKLQVDMTDGVIFKGLTVHGISGRRMFETWHIVRNLLASGRLDIQPIITHKMPLRQFGDGFDLMMNLPKMSGKIVLYPDPTLTD